MKTAKERIKERYKNAPSGEEKEHIPYVAHSPYIPLLVSDGLTGEKLQKVSITEGELVD